MKPKKATEKPSDTKKALSAKEISTYFSLPQDTKVRIRKVKERLSRRGDPVGAYYRVTAFELIDQESVIQSYKILKSWYVYYDGQITDETL